MAWKVMYDNQVYYLHWETTAMSTEVVGGKSVKEVVYGWWQATAKSINFQVGHGVIKLGTCYRQSTYKNVPVVWSHSTVNHANILGNQLNLVYWSVIIENWLLFLFSCKNDAVCCCSTNQISGDSYLQHTHWRVISVSQTAIHTMTAWWWFVVQKCINKVNHE